MNVPTAPSAVRPGHPRGRRPDPVCHPVTRISDEAEPEAQCPPRVAAGSMRWPPPTSAVRASGSASAIASVISRCTNGDSDAATSSAGLSIVANAAASGISSPTYRSSARSAGPFCVGSAEPHPGTSPRRPRPGPRRSVPHRPRRPVLRSHLAEAIADCLRPLQRRGRAAERVTLQQDQRPHPVGIAEREVDRHPLPHGCGR
jgi:hypothetical protein